MQSKFKDVYRRLVRLRIVEEFVLQEYPKQQMRCPMHMCLGQEGISAGAASVLAQGDVLFGTHRSHGPYIASGGDVENFFKELYGKANAICNGRAGSMHLLDMDARFFGAFPIVASCFPIATGAAWAFKLQKKAQLSMVIFGEAATEEGVFHESIQFAVLKQLPVIYVCENNGFSVNTPLIERRPPQVSITELVKAHGVQTLQGNGNDVFSVHELCTRAADEVRKGHGPFFLEFETYRNMEHCGPNDDHHMPCRSQEAYEKWKKLDPILWAEKNLLAQGVHQDVMDAIKNEEFALVSQAVQNAQAAPFPDAASVTRYVYAEDKNGCSTHMGEGKKTGSVA